MKVCYILEVLDPVQIKLGYQAIFQLYQAVLTGTSSMYSNPDQDTALTEDEEALHKTLSVLFIIINKQDSLLNV